MLNFHATMLTMIQSFVQTQTEVFEQVLAAKPTVVADAVLKREMIGESSLDEVLTNLAELLGISKTDALNVLGISRSRKSKNPTMNVELLDRTYSALTLFARVAVVLGQDAARTWFTTPKANLDSATPVSLLATRVGMAKLESLLSALEDGSFL